MYKHFPTASPEGELSFFISVNQAFGICKSSKSQSTLVHNRQFKYILLMVPLISTYGDANSSMEFKRAARDVTRQMQLLSGRRTNISTKEKKT